MTERQGSLIRWKAECGHWMVCYSLEPTPAQCPDCADKDRDAIEAVVKRWKKDLRHALSEAEDCSVDDVKEWLSEDGITPTPEVLTKLQYVAGSARDACQHLDDAHREAEKLLLSLPSKAERLVIPEAS